MRVIQPTNYCNCSWILEAVGRWYGWGGKKEIRIIGRNYIQ